jgi:hypothetical protein
MKYCSGASYCSGRAPARGPTENVSVLQIGWIGPEANHNAGIGAGHDNSQRSWPITRLNGPVSVAVSPKLWDHVSRGTIRLGESGGVEQVAIGDGAGTRAAHSVSRTSR